MTIRCLPTLAIALIANGRPVVHLLSTAPFPRLISKLKVKHRPQAHIFSRSMQTWFTLPENVPSFPEGFDRSVGWPIESLKNLNELTGSD